MVTPRLPSRCRYLLPRQLSQEIQPEFQSRTKGSKTPPSGHGSQHWSQSPFRESDCNWAGMWSCLTPFTSFYVFCLLQCGSLSKQAHFESMYVFLENNTVVTNYSFWRGWGSAQSSWMEDAVLLWSPLSQCTQNMGAKLFTIRGTHWSTRYRICSRSIINNMRNHVLWTGTIFPGNPKSKFVKQKWLLD